MYFGFFAVGVITGTVLTPAEENAAAAKANRSNARSTEVNKGNEVIAVDEQDHG